MMKIRIRFRLVLLSLLLLLSCSASIPVLGYEVDYILMCDEIDPVSSSPVGSGEVFLTQSGYVYCWVNLTDVSLSHEIRFDWYTPIGELHASHRITTDSPESGQSFSTYTIYDGLEISGQAPASNPGRWIVKVFVDDSLIGTREFTIIDYDAIIQQTDALEAQVAEIVISFNELIFNYESLQEGYQELLSDYNELRETYDNMTITYEEQISNYNEILEEKNSLKEEYDSLAADYEELVSTTNQLVEDYEAVVDDIDSMSRQLSNS